MARKRKHEDHVNHEAWAIPYGDLITLLLAFFVVMYAISSINEGKFRVLSDSLNAAFRGTAAHARAGAGGTEDPRLGRRHRHDHRAAVDDRRAAAQVARGDPRQQLGRSGRRAGAIPGRRPHRSRPAYADGSSGGAAAGARRRRDRNGAGRRWSMPTWSRCAATSSGSRSKYAPISCLQAVSPRCPARPSPRSTRWPARSRNIRTRCVSKATPTTSPSTRATIPSNWELSAARAASVVHRLRVPAYRRRGSRSSASVNFVPTQTNDTASRSRCEPSRDHRHSRRRPGAGRRVRQGSWRSTAKAQPGESAQPEAISHATYCDSRGRLPRTAYSAAPAAGTVPAPYFLAGTRRRLHDACISGGQESGYAL